MSSPGVYQQRHWLRTRACGLEVYGSDPRRGSRRGTRSEAVDAPVFSEPQRSLACLQMSAGEQPWIFFFFFKDEEGSAAATDDATNFARAL